MIAWYLPLFAVISKAMGTASRPVRTCVIVGFSRTRPELVYKLAHGFADGVLLLLIRRHIRLIGLRFGHGRFHQNVCPFHQGRETFRKAEIRFDCVH